MTAAVERPRPAPPRPYRFPEFERRTLANGVQVLVAPVTKLPLVTVVAVIDAGAATDSVAREGTAALTAQLLLEGGTNRRSATELTERFEELGAAVDASATWDAAAVKMTVLSSQLRPAMSLLAEVLLSPAFPEREVSRLKAERLAELLQLRAEPRGLADDTFAKVLYEDMSRYAVPDGGSERSVAAITRDDIGGFYASRYRPGGMAIVIAGDVAPDAAESLAYESFGALSGGAPQQVVPVDRPRRTTRAVHLVAKEEAPQSELRVGHVGLPRTHPEFHRVVVMNAVLGGLFSSRINLNLRERHGYTYGAFSEFDWRRGAGPFVVSTAVKADVTAAATREVLGEIDRIREAPITEDELTLATNYLDGVFPIRYESTAAIAAALASLVTYGLPDDYYDRYRERIRAVTTDDVLRAAQTHLHPDQLQILAVTDVGEAGKGMEEFGEVAAAASLPG